ncbi:Retrovirus-related Pol polyprotein from transposon RE1 [Vitis vinifera]|uniref:Retrovirus-related Pol polyprotein from transposon RE1 n=1 Tax=Vitis vinifera TaxID=29760 RepID=A0A438BSD2_VITVI|nr:Retrovirus-related Pol polyprotein from transposon RE1 [Vitis vinifera]
MAEGMKRKGLTLEDLEFPTTGDGGTERGIFPLHVLAEKPTAFRSGIHLAWFNKIIYHGISVEELIPAGTSRAKNFFQELRKLIKLPRKSKKHLGPENPEEGQGIERHEANVAKKAFALVAATDHGDHMTFDSRQVSPLRPSSQKIVSTVNGNTTPVIGEGSLTLTDTLNLDSVLVVPSLDYNLLEYHQEIQTLDYDYHISKEDESGQSELVNQEVGELDMSGQQFGSKDVFTEIPNQSSSVEGVLNLEPDPFMKRLPHRHNRGIPKPTYEPELSTKVKYPMSNYVSTHHLFESNKSFVNQLSTVAIPNSVQEALADPRWKAAMNEEMKSLQKNETWELVECPPGKKPVGCRWIYTVKYKADGSIERFKARLVAKGYTQTYGIDYTETFAPIAKINTIRVLLSLPANLYWPLQQFDVKNAFLHGELSEEVYMDLPPGCMVSEKQCQKVCKLKKSLYGLKQSPRAWFGRFTKSMRVFGYHQSNSDHILFLKKQHGKITTLIVYVDDMVVTGNDLEERKALQNYLSREFEMKDLGPLKYFLGIEVSRSSEGIFLSQRKYALDLLQETGMSGCQPINTPIEEGLKLCVEPNQVSTDKGRYQRLVGRLMYLAHIRPDLAYALSVVSQYMHNPREQHMNAVMRILRYLKNAPGKGILFAKNVDHQSIEVYTDADWAGSVDDRRSTSGYFTFVGGNLMTWKSKKQNVVACSSAKAEFRGMVLGLCEALWLRLLLQDLDYLSRQPIQLFCDNKAACDIAHNPVQHDRTKHVEVDRFFIKEKLDDKIVELPKIRSEYQLTDILTKTVSSHNSRNIGGQGHKPFPSKYGRCLRFKPDKEAKREKRDASWETPILLASRNGIVEMVEKILQLFSMAIYDTDGQNMNIVLKAVENRRSHIYDFLLNSNLPHREIAFHAVDEQGNSALHLAGKLAGYRHFQHIPTSMLHMQWEVKWYQVCKTQAKL